MLKNLFNLSDIDLTKVYELSFKITSETYLRSLQYKILNFIVYDNSTLKRIGIVDSDLCSFCQSDKDSIKHMLFHCPKVGNFWKQIQIELKIITKQDHLLSEKTVFIGTLDTTIKNYIFVNYYILEAKAYIYSCKRKIHPPNIICFKEIIKEKCEIEKYIAFKKGAQRKFNKKWSAYIEYINEENKKDNFSPHQI